MTNKVKKNIWVYYLLKCIVYFDFFVIKYISQEIQKKIKYKYITRNTLRIESDDSILCGFY